MARDFLFEIGTEEIPAKFAPGAMSQLEEGAKKRLAELRLDFDSLKVYMTPRRLALQIINLADQQADLNTEAKGPAVKAAYDQAGSPTKAAQGFARGQGVNVEDLYVKEVNGVPYVFARKIELGQPTSSLLPQFCLDMITSLHFPKPMRWGDLEVRFARPIRWLVALFGEEVVPFEFVGLQSGKISRGHRTLGQDITIEKPADYVQKMREVFVVVDSEERRRTIWEQIGALAKKVDGQVQEDEELLSEVMHLVEYPTALLGEVSQTYMSLPEAVITTPMREHQRYFPVRSMEGKLLPYFITARNGDDRSLGIVKAGNEKVLKARLEDAAFYYREDQKTPLTELVEKLEKIVYHEKLGTVRARVERLRTLAGYISAQLGLDQEKIDLINRTAYLAKADLVTLMVYDFPELQGIMGSDYAALSGEKPEVCQGILEHYQPRFAGDKLPLTTTGRIVSIADKLDAIVGAFGIGIQPTGSQDPYALRRQAQGIVSILMEAQWDLSLTDLFSAAYQSFLDQGLNVLPLTEIQPSLQDFFQQRLRFVLQEQGLRYDTVEAVLALGSDNVYRAAKKARVLAEKRETAGFVPYSQAFVRCLNLTKKEPIGTLNPADLQDPSELKLSEEISKRMKDFDQLIKAGSYAEAYALSGELVPYIEDLFQSVMIMVEDEELKKARLALLGQCVNLLGCLGDLNVLA